MSLAGGYIFNTEAHPIDPSILYCCGIKRHNDTILLHNFEDNIDFLSLLNLNNIYLLDEQLNKSQFEVTDKNVSINDKYLIFYKPILKYLNLIIKKNLI